MSVLLQILLKSGKSHLPTIFPNKVIIQNEIDVNAIDKKNSGDGITLITARNEVIFIYSFQCYGKRHKRTALAWIVSIEIVRGQKKTGAIYESVSHTANLSVNWRHNAEYFASYSIQCVVESQTEKMRDEQEG